MARLAITIEGGLISSDLVATALPDMAVHEMVDQIVPTWNVKPTHPTQYTAYSVGNRSPRTVG